MYVQTTIAKIRIKIQELLNSMLKTTALKYVADVAPVLFLRFNYKLASFNKPFRFTNLHYRCSKAQFVKLDCYIYPSIMWQKDNIKVNIINSMTTCL
jgi:hypothetical protein